MGVHTSIQESLVWDNFLNKMVVKTEVIKRVIGNKGSVFFEAGPLYVELNNPEEILEAKETLDMHILELLRRT
jgi:hypothetical protein